MKKRIKFAGACLILSLLPLAVGIAEDITTRDGKTYKSIAVQRVEPDGLILGYEPEGGGLGSAKVRFENLPKNLQSQYGYDPQRVAAIKADESNQFRHTVEQAEKGDVESQAWLGWWYDKGNGLNDFHEAAIWFLRAAKQGHAMAQLWLACGYYKGRGVPQDYAEAYKWVNLAAAQSEHSFSGYNVNLEDAQKVRDQIVRECSPQVIAEGQRRAAAFVAKAESSKSRGEDSPARPDIVEGTRATGTGFFVTDDGYVVTCAHVVRGRTTFHVKTAGGSLPARLVTKDARLDVALLKVSGTFPALPLVPNPQPKLGDSVFTIGFPDPGAQGLKPKYTRGEISSLAGVRDDPREFQISVPVQPGNSGGALVDERGNVVGVVAAKLSVKLSGPDKLESGDLPENVNYAVKGGLVYQFLNNVPELSGKLKPPHAAADREDANSAAERAAVLVISE